MRLSVQIIFVVNVNGAFLCHKHLFVVGTRGNVPNEPNRQMLSITGTTHETDLNMEPRSPSRGDRQKRRTSQIMRSHL